MDFQIIKTTVKNIFKNILLNFCLIVVSVASIKEKTEENIEVQYSKAVRSFLQTGDKSDSFYVDGLTPAESFVRLAIEMILESLRLSEMKKQDENINTLRAINASQEMFAELIERSLRSKTHKKNVDNPKKDNDQYNTVDYLGQSFYEIPVKSSGSCMFHAFIKSVGLDELDEKETREWLKETLLSGLDSADKNISETVKRFLKVEYYKNFFLAEATANVELMKIFVNVVVNSELLNKLNDNERDVIIRLDALYNEFFTNQANNTFMDISADGAREHNDKILKNLEEKLQEKLMIEVIPFQDKDLNINLLRSFVKQVICSTVSQDLRYFGNDNILEALAFATGTNVCLFLSKDKKDSKTGVVNREWMKKETIVDKNHAKDSYLRLMNLHYDALHLIK